MTELLRWPIFRYSLFIFAAAAGAVLLLPEFRGRLLASNFLPHATCYLQNPQLIWLHASSDSIIGLSYLAISSTLAYLVYRARQDIPFHWMFLAFGLFIITCGFTHMMEVWTVWQPVYWLAGWVKLVTAVASLATAIVLPLVIPKVNGLIRGAKLSEQRKHQLETANKELEALYRRVKEMDELRSQFFANVSHELRTPLTLILGPSRGMQKAGNIDAQQREDLQIIERNAQLLLKHVNELLDAAKLEAGKMQLSPARANLGEVFRLLLSNFQGAAQSRSITLRAELPEPLIAEVDVEKVERIWLNLLSNALKFTPDRGQITCRAGTGNGKVWFSVSDSGPGIPEDKRIAIFERFRQLDGGTTRKHGGTGLGLAISKEFVDLHGGRIWVEKSAEGGACFTVELPEKVQDGPRVEMDQASRVEATEALAYVPQHVQTASSGDTPELPGARATVLVAEDSPELNKFIGEAMRREYRVLSAPNGKIALEMLREHVPDAVISDAMMPEMSGESLMAEARGIPECRDVPFLFLTARSDEEFKLRMLREGAQDFLAKPFSLEELRARVRNIVAISRSRRMLQKAVSGTSMDIVALVDQVLAQKSELEAANRAAEEARAELKRLNEELESKVEARTAELAETNEELRAFTSSVSHDLRAPLRTMRGMAEILIEIVGEQGNEELRQYASRIMHGASRMDVLLNDLLTYSRLGRGELFLEPVNMEEVVTSVLSELSADMTERKAIVSREGSLPTVKGNPTLLKQITSNLLGNAIKYVPPDRAPKVRIWCESAGPLTRVWVEDNGLGIAREHHAAIFEPFKRLHSDSVFPGTGLGLAIALKAAKRMGGSIGLDSEDGKGSRFWVELQRA